MKKDSYFIRYSTSLSSWATTPSRTSDNTRVTLGTLIPTAWNCTIHRITQIRLNILFLLPCCTKFVGSPEGCGILLSYYTRLERDITQNKICDLKTFLIVTGISLPNPSLAEKLNPLESCGIFWLCQCAIPSCPLDSSASSRTGDWFAWSWGLTETHCTTPGWWYYIGRKMQSNSVAFD